MEFSYGQGRYMEGARDYKGEMSLSEHKLYLRDSGGDITQTYIPLDKIERLRKTRKGIEVHIRPSVSFRYVAHLTGDKKHLSELAHDIVQRRGLKKQFLRSEWIESIH